MDLLDAINRALYAVENLKTAEAKQAMATVRMEGAKLAEENAVLRAEIKSLNEAVRLESVMELRHDVYWEQTATEEKGPYCPACWDGQRKPVRLLELDENRWICSVCNKTRFKPGGRERSSAAAAAASQARAMQNRMRWNPRMR